MLKGTVLPLWSHSCLELVLSCLQRCLCLFHQSALTTGCVIQGSSWSCCCLENHSNEVMNSPLTTPGSLLSQSQLQSLVGSHRYEAKSQQTVPWSLGTGRPFSLPVLLNSQLVRRLNFCLHAAWRCWAAPEKGVSYSHTNPCPLREARLQGPLIWGSDLGFYGYKIPLGTAVSSWWPFVSFATKLEE